MMNLQAGTPWNLFWTDKDYHLEMAENGFAGA